MKRIALSKGKFAIVDYEMAAALRNISWAAVNTNRQKWYARGQVKSGSIYKNLYMHRYIMELSLGRVLDPREEIDHIDGNGLNNQISNLRLASHKENTWNHAKHTENSKYLGVRYESRYKTPWRAGMMVDAKFIQLGNFATEEEAAIQRDLGSIKFFGNYAKLNFENRRKEYIAKIRSGYDPVNKPKFSCSRYVGVTRLSNGRWQALYHDGPKKVHIGTYSTEEEAAEARATALGREIEFRKT